MSSDPENGFGTNGVVNLHCSGGSATISVELPVANAGVPDPVFSAAWVRDPSDFVASIVSDGRSPPEQASVTSNDVDVPLRVGMRIDNNGVVPPGNYSYTVTVTATDN
jgi:hypothetical protein